MPDDPRVTRSKASILEAAALLISEAGFPGVSIEAVAARSGAAKTTIFVAERRRPLVEALRRAVDRGELPACTDVDRAVWLVVGPLFYRAMISFEPIDEDFVERAVESALGALGAVG